MNNTLLAFKILRCFLFLIPPTLVAQINNPVADQSYAAFNSAFLVQSNNLTYYKEALNVPGADYFWRQALDVQTAQDVYFRTKSPSAKTTVTNLLNTFLVQGGSGTPSDWSWNEYNDDLLWATTIFLRGYQYTGNQTYLNQAIYGFNLMYNRGWDNTNGGIWWTIQKTNKSPLSNSPAVIAACYLYEFTKDVNYLNKAKSIYNWTRSNLWNASTGEVWGDVFPDGSVNKSVAVFNNGGFAGAASYLYKLTGDITYFNDAKLTFDRVRTNMTASGGILASGTRQGTDLAEYIRYLGDFVHDNHLWNEYYSWLKQNADVAWSRRRTDLNIAWNDWTKQMPIDNIATSMECNSAVVIQQVTPTIQTLPANIEAENYNFMNGIQTENSVVASGGANVGYIEQGDWLEYIIKVPTSGTYNITYRVSGTNAGSVSFQQNGQTLATTSLPNTGGWQNWVSVSTTVNLSAGIQSIRLVANANGWNIDKWSAGLINSPVSFMAGDNVAVFYPVNFDSTGTLPSLIFKNNLTNNGPVPSSWSVKPVFSIEDGKSVVRISYTGNVDFYGNGEVTGPLRRNNTNVTLWNTDNPTYGVDKGSRLYQSHPWIMGVRSDGSAFGIIADNTWKQYFNLTNPVTITSEGPAFRVIVIERNNAEDLLAALSDLTGKMDLPPLWTLGFQQSRFSYTPASKVMSIADEFRNRKIPCDVLWMDIDYMDNYKVFTFNPTGFSDPTSLNNYLHNKNFKAVYMIDPGVKTLPGYFVYDQGTPGDHWVKKSDGSEFTGQVWPPVVSFPDFTRPQTRSWWSGLYKNFLSTGIDGVWNDMNEPSVMDTPNKTMPESNIHRGGDGLPGGSHLRYHNVYGLLMVKASREGIASSNPNKRPFLLSRSNFLGGQQYAATWTGDNESSWEHLKLSIPMSISLGLSGQPISGPDIGGFAGNCTGDLLGHWMAIGAYYPFSRNHTISGSVNQEPWAFGTEIENVSRNAVNRRYRLLPYLYTLVREASKTGLPLMRPAFFADHSDLNLRKEQQAFLLGKDLYIVPRWAVNPALPKGDWDEVKFENSDDGYQAHVYIRSGSVVPLANIMQSTSEYKSDSITLLMNPLETSLASGTLYHDDGEGYAYRSNNFALHEVDVTKYNADSLKVVINQVEGGKNVNRLYRIGYVTEKGIVYFPWSANTIRYVPIIKDNNTNFDLRNINTMYVAGNFKAGLTPMKMIDNQKWKLDSLNLQTGKTYTLRFIQSFNRTGAEWGGAVGISGTVKQTTDTTVNVSFTVSSNGYYSVAFDQSSLRYVIQKTPVITSLAIVGDALAYRGWNSKGLPMQQSIDDLNIYTWVGNLYASNGTTEGRLKFHSGTNGFCEDTWLYGTVADQSLSATGFVIANGCSVADNKWKVQSGETGTYKVSINVANKTVSFQRLPSTMAIVGDATSIGWNTTGLPMQQSTGRLSVFTWTGKLSASNGTNEGKFKFHSGTNSWCDDTWLYATVADQSLSATGLVMANGCSVPDNKWKVQNGEFGNYKITVDVVANTIQIQKLITELSVVGDATSAGWNAAGLKMQISTDNPNVFTWTGNLSASNGSTEGKFKFHSGSNGFCDDTWLYASVADQSLNATGLTIANGCSVPDNKWKVQPGESGTYKITVDVEAKTIKIQKIILTSLAIVGDATSAGWNTKGLLMEQSADRLNIFTWTGNLSASNGTTEGKFKFHSGTNGWCDDTWLYATVADQSLAVTGLTMANGCSVPDNKWKVQPGESGAYKITVDVEAKTIQIHKIILTSLSIVGDATSIGWDTKGLAMQQSSDNPSVFTWAGKLSASNGTSEGRFKFHSGTNSWCDDTWLYATEADQSLASTSLTMASGCSVPDNKWKVQPNETGNYIIIVDVETKTIKIEKSDIPSIPQMATVTDATSSEESSLVAVELFPNPASDYVTIKIMGLTKPVSEVALYDFQGNKVMAIAGENGTHTEEIKLHVTDLSERIYILKIQTEEGVIIKKIIK